MRLLTLTALAMLAFAANSVLNRMGVGAGLIDPVTFAVVRLVAGAVALLVLLGLRRQWRGAGPGMQAGTARAPLLPASRWIGAVTLLVYLFGFSLAYLRLDAGTGALILFGCVQITMFAGAMVAGETVPLARWVGALLAFAGLVTLLAPGGGVVSPVDVVLMALAGLGWGIYSLVGRGAGDALLATTVNFSLAVPFALVVLMLGDNGSPQGRGVWLAVISGAVTSGLGYALWYRLLPQLGAVRASVAQLTVPVLAAAGGLLLGEGISLRFVVSALLVLGGVALASR
jgi:drug/metabolite transporter (DMT)-like permease